MRYFSTLNGPMEDQMRPRVTKLRLKGKLMIIGNIYG